MTYNFGYNMGYNPLSTMPQRLDQQMFFRMIPVTNIEEANATQVDIQGTPTFFYNQSANEVYLKKLNINTGKADFVKFAKVNQVADTKDDNFKKLCDKIDGLYSLLQTEEPQQKGGKNVR